MFAGAISFNSNISEWNTKQVLHMSGMFRYASAFDQDITSWESLNLRDSLEMFSHATAWLDAYIRSPMSSTQDGPASAWSPIVITSSTTSSNIDTPEPSSS